MVFRRTRRQAATPREAAFWMATASMAASMTTTTNRVATKTETVTASATMVTNGVAAKTETVTAGTATSNLEMTTHISLRASAARIMMGDGTKTNS